MNDNQRNNSPPNPTSPTTPLSRTTSLTLPHPTSPAHRAALLSATHALETSYLSQLRTLRTRLAVNEHTATQYAKSEYERGLKRGYADGERHAKEVMMKTWGREEYSQGLKEGERKVREEMRVVIREFKDVVGRGFGKVEEAMTVQREEQKKAGVDGTGKVKEREDEETSRGERDWEEAGASEGLLKRILGGGT